MSKQLCFEVNSRSPGRTKNKDGTRKLKQPVTNNQSVQKNQNRQAVSWTLPEGTKDCKLQTLSSKQKKEKLFDNQKNKLLSTKEASGFLGVSENALRILVCRKKVKAYKLGSRLKFKLDDLADCLQQKEVNYVN